MTNRNNLAILGAMAAVAVIIGLVIAAAWGFNSGTAADAKASTGSPLHPSVIQEARPGYVLAELYQDVSLDVASGVYDSDATLLGLYWDHDAAEQSCSLQLTLADQHGRNETAATATPAPVPLDVVETYVYDPTDPSKVMRVETTHATPTPDPNRPAPVAPPSVSSTSWHGWKGRPVAIDADGLAVLDVPRDATVSAHLSVRTGPDSGFGSHSELARMPLPDASWSDGSARVRLSDASGRILLASDDIDAHYRAAVLHVEVAPLADCGGLRLRWQRPAAVVIQALTVQPFVDWAVPAAPPPTPTPAAPQALYAAVGADLRFDQAKLLAGVASSVAGHVVIPDAPTDSHVAFAIRADLAPDGLTDIRQTGSPFNARGSFSPPVSGNDIIVDVRGTPYKLYVSTQPWRSELLGGEWSLR